MGFPAASHWEVPGFVVAPTMFGLTIANQNRIAKRVGGEIAGAHGQRRHQTGKGNALALILLFAIDEEKGLVLANGAAERAAKLVQIELRGGVSK
jgi:hypothetical protein